MRDPELDGWSSSPHPEEAKDGTVALREARARWTDPLGQVSHDQGQFSECVGEATLRRYVGPEIVEAPPEVLDKSVSLR